MTACRSAAPRTGVTDRALQPAPTVQLMVDHRGGSQVATKHLLDHGRRRVACIAGPDDVSVSSYRIDGWRDALEEADVQQRMPLVHAHYGRYGGYHATLELLRRGSAVDAIFVSSDEQAIGTLRALAELGLHCPRDVAVASFDGISASAYAVPALTTMRQSFEEMGRRAVELLLDRIHAPALAPETITLPVTLMTRGSCGCDDPPGGEIGLPDQDPSGGL